MPRTNLDRGLLELHTCLAQLGSSVETAFVQTLHTLETGHHAILHSIIADDTRIDMLVMKAERQALRLLILQQPLAGQDMRLLTSSLYLSDDLGRIGDAIVSIAEAILYLAELYAGVTQEAYTVHGTPIDTLGNLKDAFILRSLLDLGQELQHVLKQTLEAFLQRDASLTQIIEAEKALISLRYFPLCDDIMTMQAKASALSTLQTDASILQRATYLLWIAQKLEQISVYTANMRKRIIYIAEGGNTSP
jgi:phosphate transport system protein